MRILVCLILAVALTAQSADAQRRRARDHRHAPAWLERRGPAEFGVRAGNDFEAGVGAAGAQLRLPLLRPLLLVPSGDVYFGDADTEWQANADVLLRPPPLGGVYVGAGAAFVDRDFDRAGEDEVRAGYNLFLGLDGGRVMDTRLRPFVEARWTEVDDYDPFRLAAGFNVPIR